MPDRPLEVTADQAATPRTALTQLGTRIPRDLKDRLRRRVYEQNTTVQHEVTAALDAYLPR